MIRRSFLSTLVALVGAPFFPKPKPLYKGIDSLWRPSKAQLEFLDFSGTRAVFIPQRKIMARVRISREILEASKHETGQFQRAHAAWIKQLLADSERAEVRTLDAIYSKSSALP